MLQGGTYVYKHTRKHMKISRYSSCLLSVNKLINKLSEGVTLHEIYKLCFTDSRNKPKLRLGTYRYPTFGADTITDSRV